MHSIPWRGAVFKVWDFDLLCLKRMVVLQNLDQVVISSSLF